MESTSDSIWHVESTQRLFATIKTIPEVNLAFSQGSQGMGDKGG